MASTFRLFLLLPLLLGCLFANRMSGQGNIGNGQVVSGSATDNQFSIWSFSGAVPGRYICASVTSSSPDVRFKPDVGFGIVGVLVDGIIGSIYGSRDCIVAKGTSGQIYIKNDFMYANSTRVYSYTLQLTMPNALYAGGGGVAYNNGVYSGSINAYGIDVWTFDAVKNDIVTIIVKAPCTNSFCAQLTVLNPDGSLYYGPYGPSSLGTLQESIQVPSTGTFTAYVFGYLNYTGPVGSNNYTFSITGSTALQPGTCPVAPLTPLATLASDPRFADPTLDPGGSKTLYLENNGGIDEQDLQPTVATALQQFRNSVNATPGGDFNLQSAFRTRAYQEHLLEVWNKKNKLATLRKNPACQAIYNDVEREITKHGIVHRPGDPLKPNYKRHTIGAAIDVDIETSGLTSQQMLSLGCAANLYRPFSTDHVHFELRPTASTRCQ